jgi:hypothetical protein
MKSLIFGVAMFFLGSITGATVMQIHHSGKELVQNANPFTPVTAHPHPSVQEDPPVQDYDYTPVDPSEQLCSEK